MVQMEKRWNDEQGDKKGWHRRGAQNVKKGIKGQEEQQRNQKQKYFKKNC